LYAGCIPVKQTRDAPLKSQHDPFSDDNQKSGVNNGSLFSRLDLEMAYRALIEAFIRAESPLITPSPNDEHDVAVYDTS
jgi:hypothetical protein